VTTKINENDLYSLSSVEVYKIVLSGGTNRFPKGFWTGASSKQNAIDVTKYLIDDFLKLSDDDLMGSSMSKIFMKNKLGGMLSMIYSSSSYEAINSSYPGKIKPWQLATPSSYWTIKTGIEATKWLLEEKLKWSDEEIKEKWCGKILKENKLGGMRNVVYNASPYNCINSAYPDKFKPWEFKKVPKNFWSKETGIEATKWLIEEKLKWSDDDVKAQLSGYTFNDNGLAVMVSIVFHNSTYSAINAVYPNKFKAWEFNYTATNYWTIETGIEATKWLIEEKLKWTDEEITKNINVNIFIENKLYNMLFLIYNRSSFDAINSAYPGRFKPWELRYTPTQYWNTETGIQATKWLVEEKLKCLKDDIIIKVTRNMFLKNGLWGMLTCCYEKSYKQALKTAYPELEIDV
jgi:predicted transposase YbfD/YdcC